MFPKNEGPVDRAIRIVAGLVLIPSGLFLLDGVGAAAPGLVVAAVGLGSLVTGLTGRCLLYYPFDISTIPEAGHASVHRVHRIGKAA